MTISVDGYASGSGVHDDNSHVQREWVSVGEVGIKVTE